MALETGEGTDASESDAHQRKVKEYQQKLEKLAAQQKAADQPETLPADPPAHDGGGAPRENRWENFLHDKWPCLVGIVALECVLPFLAQFRDVSEEAMKEEQQVIRVRSAQLMVHACCPSPYTCDDA